MRATDRIAPALLRTFPPINFYVSKPSTIIPPFSCPQVREVFFFTVIACVVRICVIQHQRYQHKCSIAEYPSSYDERTPSSHSPKTPGCGESRQPISDWQLLSTQRNWTPWVSEESRQPIIDRQLLATQKQFKLWTRMQHPRVHHDQMVQVQVQKTCVIQLYIALQWIECILNTCKTGQQTN